MLMMFSLVFSFLAVVLVTSGQETSTDLPEYTTSGIPNTDEPTLQPLTTSVSPDQTISNECQARYPNATYITGKDLGCTVLCYGYTRIGFVIDYINDYPVKADGTPCAQDRECLGGVCHSKENIRLCLENEKGTLKYLTVEGCQIRCRSDDKVVLETTVARPEKIPCSAYTVFPPVSRSGACDGKGICLADPVGPFTGEYYDDDVQ